MLLVLAQFHNEFLIVGGWHIIPSILSFKVFSTVYFKEYVIIWYLKVNLLQIFCIAWWPNEDFNQDWCGTHLLRAYYTYLRLIRSQFKWQNIFLQVSYVSDQAYRDAKHLDADGMLLQV